MDADSSGQGKAIEQLPEHAFREPPYHILAVREARDFAVGAADAYGPGAPRGLGADGREWHPERSCDLRALHQLHRRRDDDDIRTDEDGRERWCARAEVIECSEQPSDAR